MALAEVEIKIGNIEQVIKGAKKPGMTIVARTDSLTALGKACEEAGKLVGEEEMFKWCLKRKPKWIPYFLWRFLFRLLIELRGPEPPEHINCRCILLKDKSKERMG